MKYKKFVRRERGGEAEKGRQRGEIERALLQIIYISMCVAEGYI